MRTGFLQSHWQLPWVLPNLWLKRGPNGGLVGPRGSLGYLPPCRPAVPLSAPA